MRVSPHRAQALQRPVFRAGRSCCGVYRVERRPVRRGSLETVCSTALRDRSVRYALVAARPPRGDQRARQLPWQPSFAFPLEDGSPNSRDGAPAGRGRPFGSGTKPVSDSLQAGIRFSSILSRPTISSPCGSPAPEGRSTGVSTFRSTSPCGFTPCVRVVDASTVGMGPTSVSGSKWSSSQRWSSSGLWELICGAGCYEERRRRRSGKAGSFNGRARWRRP